MKVRSSDATTPQDVLVSDIAFCVLQQLYPTANELLKNKRVDLNTPLSGHGYLFASSTKAENARLIYLVANRAPSLLSSPGTKRDYAALLKQLAKHPEIDWDGAEQIAWARRNTLFSNAYNTACTPA